MRITGAASDPPMTFADENADPMPQAMVTIIGPAPWAVEWSVKTLRGVAIATASHGAIAVDNLWFRGVRGVVAGEKDWMHM